MNSVGLALFWTSRNPEEAYKSENIIPSDDALLSVIPRLQSAGMSLDKVDLMGHLEVSVYHVSRWICLCLSWVYIITVVCVSCP